MRGRISEEAESRARVLRVRDAEESGNDLDVRVQRNADRGQLFRPAIKQEDEESNQKVDGPHGVSGHELRLTVLNWPNSLRTLRKAQALVSSSFSTALQRSQTVGYILSSPTCVE